MTAFPHLPPDRALAAGRHRAAREQLEQVVSRRFVGRWRRRGVVVGLGISLAVAGGAAAAATGVFSRPEPGSGSVGTPIVAPAAKGTIRSDLAPPPTDPTYTKAQQEVIYQNELKLAECLRENGFPTFPMPNPDFGNGKTPPIIVGGPNGGNIDAGTKAFQSTLQACTTETDPQPVPSG